MNRQNIRQTLGAALALVLSACATLPKPPGPVPIPDVVDPILVWGAPLASCGGGPLDPASLAYNIYAVQGPGPIPTVPTPNDPPCGVRQLAAIAPINETPIAATTYNALVPEGQWTFAVETVSGGERSTLSASITVNVKDAPGPPTGLQLGATPCADLVLEGVPPSAVIGRCVVLAAR